MLFMARLVFSVPYVTISRNSWCSSKFVEFNVFFVSKLLNIHSKPWKWVFLHPDCSEHFAITEKSLIDVLRIKPSHSWHIYNHVYSFLCVCDKGLDFFLVKLLAKRTNCNIKVIFNYFPYISISTFNSNCPVRDNVPCVT